MAKTHGTLRCCSPQHLRSGEPFQDIEFRFGMLCLNILLMKNRQVAQENVISVQWGPWKEVPCTYLLGG